MAPPTTQQLPFQIVFVLVGHKCDLAAQRHVSREEAEKLAAAYHMKYIETSARDSINVEQAFTELTRDIYELVRRGEITMQEEHVTLHPIQPPRAAWLRQANSCMNSKQ
uniref:RAB39B, member RAS oncogene family a n=1 Tax=Callorhinchus milii TaxID=7868 RepID=A0A4W3H2R5_CALMI